MNSGLPIHEWESENAPELFRQIVENSSDAIWIGSEDMEEILYINEAVEREFGFPREDLYADPLAYLEIVHPDDRADERELIARMQEWAADNDAPERIHDEYRIYDADGDLRWVSDVTFPIYDKTGALRWWAGIIRDITERKEYAIRLEQQNKRLQTIATALCELRTPLDLATGRLNYFRDDLEGSSRESIRSALDQTVDITEDVITLVRQSQPVEETEPVDLREAVQGCWRTLDAANAELAIEIDAEVRIEADPARLRLLVRCLLSNTVIHGGPGVTTTVGALADGSGFYIEDDGPGIPEDDRNRVFNLGYSASGDGTGLGLNIARAVAEAHGWELAIESDTTAGTRVTIAGITKK